MLCLSLAVAASAQSRAPAFADMRWDEASKAQWIAAPGIAADVSGGSGALPIFRRTFLCTGGVTRATLRISGLGQYEVRLNGRPLTEAVLTPAWTDYRRRVLYDSYDVTMLLRAGENTIGVMLGNGMYNVQETKGRYTKWSGPYHQPKLILQLQLRLADGSSTFIVSDSQWKTTPGPIVFSSIYGGEDYDARLEQRGWDRPGFEDKSWSSAVDVEGPGGILLPATAPPIRLFARHRPVRITHPNAGVAVYDLGQNFAGWPEITVTGERGAAVKLIAGELLDKRGFVTQRSANAFPDSENSFTYTLRGGGIEQWHPRFSYYGFRYVQVERKGSGTFTLRRLDGRPLHADVQTSGRFDSSDQLLNRIHKLIDRAMLSNTVSVLTDCPHREKLGWLEQTHLAGPSLMYNYDLHALYAKVADDMQDAQQPDGLVPDIAPEFTVFEGSFRDSPEWGSAVVLSTWEAYQFYGDRRLLENHYESMRKYLAYLHRKASGHLLTYGLGDWYDIGPGSPGVSQLTSPGLTASAIYYQDLVTMQRIAELLGSTAEAKTYEAESLEVKHAFNERFFHADRGTYDKGSQAAQAMPLVIGLTPEGSRDAVLANLVADIRAHGNHVTAGDIGFHYVIRALTDSGRSDVIYDMLSRTDKPSYGDQLARGATTLTEAWDANPDSSQNHFMLGHAEEWFYRGLAGIDFDRTRTTDERIYIHPAVVGSLTQATARFDSSLGRVQSSWHRTGHRVQFDVIIPAGNTATFAFPEGCSGLLRHNGSSLKNGSRLRGISTSDAGKTWVIGAGTHHFTASM